MWKIAPHTSPSRTRPVRTPAAPLVTYDVPFAIAYDFPSVVVSLCLIRQLGLKVFTVLFITQNYRTGADFVKKVKNLILGPKT